MSFWRKTTVLGRQFADAQDAEAKRLASGSHGQSPMPKGEYRQDQGDYKFLSVTPLPIDLELRALVESFATFDDDSRSRIRACISMDEQYTLIHFAKRSAVMSLNERSIKRCKEGLLALAMLDEQRIDFRDAAWAAGLLSYAATSLEQESGGLFKQAASISTKGMANILKRNGKTANLSDWGYSEFSDGNGVGLIKSDNAKYEPSVPLTEIAIGVSSRLSDGEYVAEPTIATELPSVWFPQATRSSAEFALKSALGTIQVSGKLRDSVCENAKQQMFSLWIAEMPKESDSESLRNCVGSGLENLGRFVITFSVGRLFGLGVAGSYVEGASPYESLESLSMLSKMVELQLAETKHW